MPLASLLVGTVAVLCPDRIAVVATSTLTVRHEVRLRSPAAGVYPAPDGALVVPLRDADATLVAGPGDASTTWRGRLFPLFIDEPDRLYAVFPGAVVSLSYPERVQIMRLPVDGLAGARLAVTSRDGRLVAIVPVDAPDALLEVLARTGGTVLRVPVGGEVTALAVADPGTVAVAGVRGGRLAAVVTGEGLPRTTLAIGGEVRAVAFSGDGREVFAGLEVASGGAFVALRLHEGREAVLVERKRIALDAPVVALAAAGDDVVVLTPNGLVRFEKNGTRVAHTVAMPGCSALAVLPATPRSLVPAWSAR